MSKPMTRREFFRRTVPLVAAGAVSTSFVGTLFRQLFPPKKYWDLGAVPQDGLLLDMDVTSVTVWGKPRKLKCRWSPNGPPGAPYYEQQVIDRLAQQMLEIDQRAEDVRMIAELKAAKATEGVTAAALLAGYERHGVLKPPYIPLQIVNVMPNEGEG